MSAAVIGDLNHTFSRLNVEASESRVTKRTDAHLGIKELEALRRLDLDMVAPPEAADLAEPLVALYQGTPTSGDHLRLPQLTHLDAQSLRSAVGRVLAVDTTAIAGSQDAVLKEAKMRRVLKALDSAVADIQRRATIHSRE
jgi:hypothetical protein